MTYQQMQGLYALQCKPITLAGMICSQPYTVYKDERFLCVCIDRASAEELVSLLDKVPADEHNQEA